MGRVARYKKEKRVRNVEDVFQGDERHDDAPKKIKGKSDLNGFSYSADDQTSKWSAMSRMMQIESNVQKKHRNKNETENGKGKKRKRKNDTQNIEKKEKTKKQGPDVSGIKPGETIREFNLRIGRETRSILNQQGKKNSVSLQRKKEYLKQRKKAKMEEKRKKRLENLEKVLQQNTSRGFTRDFAEKPPEFRLKRDKLNLDLDSTESRKRFAKLAPSGSKDAGVKNQLEALSARVNSVYNERKRK